MRFSKMHGIGNDYISIDAFRDGVPGNPGVLAMRMSDRHYGIGADGLIIVAPPEDKNAADARMLMFNADGSRSEMCGNGLRCAAKLAYDHGHVDSDEMRFETGAGILHVKLTLVDGHCIGATVKMGPPRLSPETIPVFSTSAGPLIPLKAHSAGQDWELLAIGMGNPHGVCFTSGVESLDLASIGPDLEHADCFPNRANIEFVEQIDEQEGVAILRQRTWERGSGETQACGTGACATAVAAILSQRISGRAAIIRLNGGDLHISWPDDSSDVIMSGAATHVFDGDWPDDPS